MALAYSTIKTQVTDAGFLARLEIALIQVIKQPNGPLQHEPMSLHDQSTKAQLDRLSRSILAQPSFWATQYADLVGNQLIGKSSLLDATVTTDGDLFSAANAVFADLLPSLP